MKPPVKSSRNDAVFKQLYAKNNAKILNYIAKRVLNREDAEDITSEVFLRVYKNLPDFRWQGVNVESWIYKIARNAIIDYYRKFGKERGNIDIDSAASKIVDKDSKDLLLSLLEGEEEVALYKAISNLPPQDQYLIYYKYFEELPISEIAARLDLSETNIGTRLHRLRKKLLNMIRTKNDKKN